MQGCCGHWTRATKGHSQDKKKKGKTHTQHIALLQRRGPKTLKATGTCPTRLSHRDAGDVSSPNVPLRPSLVVFFKICTSRRPLSDGPRPTRRALNLRVHGTSGRVPRERACFRKFSGKEEARALGQLGGTRSWFLSRGWCFGGPTTSFLTLPFPHPQHNPNPNPKPTPSTPWLVCLLPSSPPPPFPSLPWRSSRM